MKSRKLMRLPLTLSPRRRRQLWYAPLLALAMGVLVARLLVMAQLLDLHAFAGFSAGLLVSSTFCMVCCGGLQSLLQREWPGYLVRGQGLRGLVGAAQCNLLTVGATVLFALAAVGGISVAGAGPALVIVGVLHGAAQQSFLVATTESRSRGDALAYAWQQLTRAALTAALGVTVAQITASPVATVAVEALVSAGLGLWIGFCAMKVAGHDWRFVYVLAARRLPCVHWRSALTLMLVMLLGFAVLNADRWMAERLLEPAAFAQYSLVAVLLGVAQALQALVNASVYPLLARRFATVGAAATFGICLRVSVVMLVAGALLFVPVSVVLQYGISRWYPRYADVAALVPLLLAAAILRVSDFWSSYLVIAGRERRLLWLNSATIAIAAGAWLAGVGALQPSPITPRDVAVLALVLSLLGYAGAAAAAWRAPRA